MKLLEMNMLCKNGTVIVLESRTERELVKKWYKSKGCKVYDCGPPFSIRVYPEGNPELIRCASCKNIFQRLECLEELANMVKEVGYRELLPKERSAYLNNIIFFANKATYTYLQILKFKGLIHEGETGRNN